MIKPLDWGGEERLISLLRVHQNEGKRILPTPVDNRLLGH
jgi:hypothetical protein